MLKADIKDRSCVIDILADSFYDNKSVNYIIKQDSKKLKRIRNLMGYSFDVCFNFGKVFLSDNRQACALVIVPDKKKSFIKSAILDLKLIFGSIGFANIKKAMSRESKIKSFHPRESMYYLWFIGVSNQYQGKGLGSDLLKEILQEAKSAGRLVCLETSTLKNIPWYQKFGFIVYNELNLTYKLFFLKK